MICSEMDMERGRERETNKKNGYRERDIERERVCM